MGRGEEVKGEDEVVEFGLGELIFEAIMLPEQFVLSLKSSDHARHFFHLSLDFSLSSVSLRLFQSPTVVVVTILLISKKTRLLLTI